MEQMMTGMDYKIREVADRIRELRLISGKTDRRYSLPDTCIGATIWNKNIFAVSKDTLYRVGQTDRRFTAYTLPMEREATRLMGTLTNGKAIVACGDEVYVITLPLGSVTEKK